MCLYFANGGCIYISAKELRNINVRFEQNVNKFNRAHNTKNVHNETEQPIEQPNDSSAILNNSIEQIQAYIDRCNSEQISLEVIKANIRILNAMTDSYKRGYSELTNRILEQRLEEKINSAKRDFVKRECKLAIAILHMLKTNNIEMVIEYLRRKYPI
jgi:HPt (histidine-containing phosphotransfer) domain-containing protein